MVVQQPSTHTPRVVPLHHLIVYALQFYVLGAYLISHYADMPFEDFVSQRIFKPIGMSTTTFSPTVANNSELLTHTWTPFGRRIPFWFDESLAHLKAGAGGIISSADDMVRWLSVLLNEGRDPTTNKTVIPKSVFDAVTTSQIIMAGKPTATYGSSIVGYGMGWIRSSVGTADVSKLGFALIALLLTRYVVDRAAHRRYPWVLDPRRVFA